MHEHVTDAYVREARRHGYRSRAAFKLLELDRRDQLLKPGLSAADLGAAPGSWSQVLRERLGPGARIVAIDLLPMIPLPGVDFVQADFSTAEGLAAIEGRLGAQALDLVVCDLSPNISGVGAVDQARSLYLADLALDFGQKHLREGGDLVVKVFQGPGLDEFRRAVGAGFDKVYARKPDASRGRSREQYVVAKGRRPAG